MFITSRYNFLDATTEVLNDPVLSCVAYGIIPSVKEDSTFDIVIAGHNSHNDDLVHVYILGVMKTSRITNSDFYMGMWCFEKWGQKVECEDYPIETFVLTDIEGVDESFGVPKYRNLIWHNAGMRGMMTINTSLGSEAPDRKTAVNRVHYANINANVIFTLGATFWRYPGSEIKTSQEIKDSVLLVLKTSGVLSTYGRLNTPGCVSVSAGEEKRKL